MIGFKKQERNHLNFTHLGHRGHFTGTQEWSKDRLLFLFSIKPLVSCGAFAAGICSSTLQCGSSSSTADSRLLGLPTFTGDQRSAFPFSHWFVFNDNSVAVWKLKSLIHSYKPSFLFIAVNDGLIIWPHLQDLLFRSSWKLFFWKSSC